MTIVIERRRSLSAIQTIQVIQYIFNRLSIYRKSTKFQKQLTERVEFMILLIYTLVNTYI